MLIFTNRQLDEAFKDERQLTAKYIPFAPDLSCCLVSQTSNVKPKWKIEQSKTDLDDERTLEVLVGCLTGDRPVLLYVHGNNTTPNACFARCKHLEDQYGVSTIGFSWTSEGFQPNGADLAGVSSVRLSTDAGDESLASVKRDNLNEGWIQRKARRYAQAKINAQHSGTALARFMRLIASARLATMKQPFSVAVHSLGCHFFHYAVTHEGASESLGVAHNIAFLAGCTGAAKHAAWIGQINPLRKVYITFTNDDSVLAAAKVIDGDTKLGANPGTELLSAPKYRYVDFEGAARMVLGAHRYFVADPNKSLSKPAQKLFGRIFTSQDDVLPGENLRKVYPVICTPDGAVCYMGGGSGNT
jgi:hypothetical protein